MEAGPQPGQITATLTFDGVRKLDLKLPAGDLLANLQQLKAGSVEVLSKELGVTTAQADAEAEHEQEEAVDDDEGAKPSAKNRKKRRRKDT